MENKKKISILGWILVAFVILFTGAPFLFEFILIMYDKKTDFTFKHNYYILGTGFTVGVLLIVSPELLLSLIRRFASSKLPKEEIKNEVS
jgi:ABC-type arginine/histidine transport system permease subunit